MDSSGAQTVERRADGHDHRHTSTARMSMGQEHGRGSGTELGVAVEVAESGRVAPCGIRRPRDGFVALDQGCLREGENGGGRKVKLVHLEEEEEEGGAHAVEERAPQKRGGGAEGSGFVDSDDDEGGLLPEWWHDVDIVPAAPASMDPQLVHKYILHHLRLRRHRTPATDESSHRGKDKGGPQTSDHDLVGNRHSAPWDCDAAAGALRGDRRMGIRRDRGGTWRGSTRGRILP